MREKEVEAGFTVGGHRVSYATSMCTEFFQEGNLPVPFPSSKENLGRDMFESTCAEKSYA